MDLYSGKFCSFSMGYSRMSDLLTKHGFLRHILLQEILQFYLNLLYAKFVVLRRLEDRVQYWLSYVAKFIAGSYELLFVIDVRVHLLHVESSIIRRFELEIRMESFRIFTIKTFLSRKLVLSRHTYTASVIAALPIAQYIP